MNWENETCKYVLGNAIMALKWLLMSTPPPLIFLWFIISTYLAQVCCATLQACFFGIFLTRGHATLESWFITVSQNSTLSKTQSYLVSLPHLLGRSCHSWASCWPAVAPLCTAPRASLRYPLSVIRALISSVHTVRRTAQTQVAAPIASTHLSKLFKLPRARGAHNLFSLRERNGWSGSSHCRSDSHLDWTKM